MDESDEPEPVTDGPGQEEEDEEEEEAESPFLIIDVEEPQSTRRIEALRDGEGPLADSLFEVLESLHAQGHVGDEVMPVVFVVRERSVASEEE